MPLFLWIVFANKNTVFSPGRCVWCSTFVFSCVLVSWNCFPRGRKQNLLQTTESLFGCIFRVGMALFFTSWHLIFFLCSPWRCSLRSKKKSGGTTGYLLLAYLAPWLLFFFPWFFQVFPAKRKRFWGGLRGTCYWHILLVVMALFFVSKSCSSSQCIMCRSRFRLCGYINVGVYVSVPYHICVVYFCASRICVSESCFSSRFSMCRSRCRLCGYVNIYAGM